MLKSKGIQGGGDFTTVLNEVRGFVDNYDYKDLKRGFGKEGTRTFVWLNMSQLSVLAVEDGTNYPYDKAKVPIGNFSDYDSSAWYAFEQSIAEALGQDISDVSVDSVVGHSIHLKKTYKDYEIEGEKKQGIIWKVLSVDGGAAKEDPFDVALRELGGKQKGEFKGQIVANSTVKTDGNLIKAILDDSFFADPRVTAKYTVVDGVYTAI